MNTDNGFDGLSTITKLIYKIDSKSENPNDNIFTIHNDRIFYINISTFLSYTRFENDTFYNYDLREPKRKILNPDRLRETRNSLVTTDNWTNIPYYPTTKERRENVAKHLLSIGKKVPDSLLKQIQEDSIKEVRNDCYNPPPFKNPPLRKVVSNAVEPNKNIQSVFRRR